MIAANYNRIHDAKGEFRESETAPILPHARVFVDVDPERFSGPRL
jgi:hypothetical protein